MLTPARRPLRRLAAAGVAATALVALAGCSAFTPQSPSPTPTDFAGIVDELAKVGIGVDHVTSGDAGCDDQRLARASIGFDAQGLDQADLIRIHLYSFKDQATYNELRPSVDACARSYVTDATSFASVDAPPYVLAGSGPWTTRFKDALRSALEHAAAGG